MPKCNIEVKLLPFEVPYVALEGAPSAPAAPPAELVPPQHDDRTWCDPSVGQRRFLLSELPVEALQGMCNDFKREVFKRAGKEMPRPEAEELRERVAELEAELSKYLRVGSDS